MKNIKQCLKREIKNSFLYRAFRTICEHSEIRYEAARWTSHDEKMARFYSQFVKSGDLCFDIGANIGNRVKVFLKLGAAVVAVEPQTACVQSLKIAYGRNSKLTLVQKVLGKASGEASRPRL